MLIGLEVAQADRSEKTGVDWYAWHVTQALKRTPGQETHTWLMYSRETVSNGLGQAPSNWHPRALSWPIHSLWTNVRLSFELHRHRPDVLFMPAGRLPRIIPKHSVVILSDVGFFRHPHLYSSRELAWLRFTTKDCLRRASQIIAVSDYAKQELVQHGKVQPERITVIHPGSDHLSTERVSEGEQRSVTDAYRIPGPYFLAVGQVGSRQNYLTLIEGFRRYKEDRGLGDPTCLVLVGSPGENHGQIEAAIQRAKMGGSIVQTGYLAEEDKRVLMMGAIALVQAAWSTRFGLAGLEAESLGCPVIAARSGSLPELLGVEEVCWFDPADAETLAQALDRLTREQPYRDSLIAQGKDWSAQYRWEDAAKQTLNLFTNWSNR
ncbi:glycosyltransferase family 4 protein [Patescibacteria group bacterium]|nr:glycosyltransferase family 4 protein [Patescibacteria group bacterium]